jgi:hypothetical protein
MANTVNRRRLLPIASLVATLSCWAVPSLAIDDVVCLNCTTEPTTIANDIAVAANWVTQLERMTTQIQEQILIFQQLSGLTNVNAMAAVLNQAGNFNQMNSFGNVPHMLQGNGFGNLGGLGQGYLTQNTVFMPTAGSPMPQLNTLATLFNNRAGSLASVQAMSAQLLLNSNVILNGLMTLQHLIDGQPSSQLMGGMNARLASYQGNIASQQYQLAQMQAFANAQQRVFDEQEKQAVFCSAYSLAANNPSLTGAGLNVAGEGHCAVAGGGAVPVAGVGAVAVAGAGGADTAGFDTPVPAAGTIAANTLPVPPIPPADVPPPVNE